MPFKDPIKQKEYRKIWGRKNDGPNLRKRRAKQYAVINRIKLEIGCEHCGYCDHPGALEFHHIEPKDKEFSISSAIGWNLVRILKETEKCLVLCSNCHAVEEYRLNDKSLY